MVLTKRSVVSGTRMISNIVINLFSFEILLLKIIAMATAKLIPKAFIVSTCKQILLTATGSSHN